MKGLLITLNGVEFKAVLFDTPTAGAIYNALPFEGDARRWGDELYFGIPVRVEQEALAKEVVEIGDLAFWPPGSAFCIFFGKTPVSRGNEPRAYSPVNVFGKITGDTKELKNFDSNVFVRVQKA